MMRKLVWVWCVLCLGCMANVDDAPAVRRDQTSALASEPQLEARAKLEARLDASNLALGPRAPVSSAAAFDEARALAALEAASGTKVSTEWSGETWSVASESLLGWVDSRSGSVQVRASNSYSTELPQASDEVLRARARALLAGFASDVESAHLELKHVGATVRALGGGGEISDGRLATKVFAFRKLGDLSVAGNRLVASYLTDGTLHAVRGVWPSIDLSRSRLTSTLSVAEALARATDTLVAHGVNADRPDPIVLESFYELRTDETGSFAVLRGSALVQTYGPDGDPGRRERHDFDL